MPNTGKKHRSRRYLIVLIRALARLPLPLLYLIADIQYLLMFYAMRFQRALVMDNIRYALPELTPTEQQRLAARSCRNTVHVLFETIKALRLAPEQLEQRVQLENPQLIYDLLQRHRTVVVAGAHQGNWEWMQLACAAQLNIRIATLYKPISEDKLDTLLRNIRSRFGGTLIAANGPLTGLARFARDGGVVAVLADQGPRPDEEQYWSTFLGRDTAFFPGLEKLTQLLHAPLVFVHMQRTGKGHYRLRLEQLAEDPGNSSDHAIMERYIGCVEAQVRAAPEDWLWMYKRWKYCRDDSVQETT